MKNKAYTSLSAKTLLGVVACFTTVCAYSESVLKYHDLATSESNGINYSSQVRPNNEILDALKQFGVVLGVSVEERANAPARPHGAPGVAIFDYDRDGDLDIYVTNAVGTANSLFSNQLVETGKITFIDKALEAGVGASDQDTTGVCFGDIDNDNDLDLFVMGNFGTGNRLFENNGNGSFTDISITSGTRAGDKHPSSCALGDVNGDGLLDLLVGNTYDNWNHRLPLITFNNDHLMEGNQLFQNIGNNVFEDVSEISKLNKPTRISWAVSLVDYDLDGDLDVITADDQGAKAFAVYGGVDDGYIRLYKNNGKGVFSDLTETIANTNRVGGWMGLSFSDLNHDGIMDIFATNVGYYMTAFLRPVLDFPTPVGDWKNGWFIGSKDGSFNFAGLGNITGTPFGWGTSITDYDNDGDSDIIYHGGINMGVFVDASNPGVILSNDGSGNFTRDSLALSESTNHSRRNVQGMAVGDINKDGFMDIISVSSENWPEQFPLFPYVPEFQKIGTPFDDETYMWPLFAPIDEMDFTKGFQWTGMDTVNGTLSVEVSSADNGNNWIKVRLKGTVGLLEKATVNRDGIGAVVSFTPSKGITSMWPVTAGSSYASQNALERSFGLGKAKKGTLEIMWPGGIVNKLYGVRAGESILLPEIPCSYKDKTSEFYDYYSCVNTSLNELKNSKVVSSYKDYHRYMSSAVRAYFEYRGMEVK